VGVALITCVAWLVFKQKLDVAALMGLTLIVAGVLVLFLFSKTAAHR
jgi:multidrug transporter EmrE-like cation transporter